MAVAVLGMRGTGSWSSDERPKNYREAILHLFPNGKAPLTAVMSKLKEQVTDDPEFKWFEKGISNQRTTVNGSQTDSDTSIEVATGYGLLFKAGHAVMNERTLEIFWVTTDPAADTLTVLRGKGRAAAAMNDLDGLIIIGTAHMEGAAVPSAITHDPSVVYNYTQIFRNSINITGTGDATKLRTGDQMVEMKREALEIHSIEMEKAFMFGGRLEDTSGAHPKRSTGGLMYYISTNIKDFADAVTKSAWELHLEDVFKYGSNEKLLLCGNRVLTVMSQMAMANGTMMTPVGSDAYGMDMNKYITPSGTLYLKSHPLLSENATFKDWGFIVDVKKLVYRPLKGRDTKFLQNVQSKGDDAIKHEYLTECGLEVQFEKTHSIIKNASAFIP